MMLVLNVLYLIILGVLFLGSFVIIFHMIRYSYDKVITLLTLTIFTCVMGALLFMNVMLFYSINFENVFSLI